MKKEKKKTELKDVNNSDSNSKIRKKLWKPKTSGDRWKFEKRKSKINNQF